MLCNLYYTPTIVNEALRHVCNVQWIKHQMNGYKIQAYLTLASFNRKPFVTRLTLKEKIDGRCNVYKPDSTCLTSPFW